MGRQPDTAATITRSTSRPDAHARTLVTARADRPRRRRGQRVVAASVAVAAILAVAGAGGAAAADGPTDGGLWYFTTTGMEKIHQTTQGKGITIAVLDSQVNPAAPDLIGVDVTVHEPSYCADTIGGPALPASSTDATAAHGTGMDGIIAGTGIGYNGDPGQRGIAPRATIHHYTVTYEPGGVDRCRPSAELNGRSGFAAAIDQAVADGADIINASNSGPDNDEDSDAIGRALNSGVILVAAGPHDGGTMMKSPADANGAVAVESSDPSGALPPETTTSPLLTVVAPGEKFREITGDWTNYRYFGGSSNATAYTSAALALVWSAYPKATGNQILQCLIRNTGGADHPLGRDDSWGYGLVNVRHMLEHDPTQYPDTNPLLREGAKPSTAQILGTAPSVASSARATSGGSSGGMTVAGVRTGVSAGALVVGGVGLVVLLIAIGGATLLGTVLARRRTAPPVPPAPPEPPAPPGAPGAPGS